MSSLDERASYWRRQVDTAARAVDAWASENSFLSWGDSVTLAARNAERFLSRARLLVDTPGQFWSIESMDAQIRPLVEGAYLQISEAPPRWTDPVKETAREVTTAVVETVKTATTWGAGGIGLGLVLVGAAYLVATGRLKL